MWGTIASWGFKFLIMPLFSGITVWLVNFLQERQEEARRNAEIDAALKRFKEAQTAKEQEDAFKDLIRRRGPNS